MVCQLIGCASFSKINEIELSSIPRSKAIVLDKNGDQISEVSTPAKVTLAKGGTYTINFTQDGYFSDQAIVEKRFNHSFWWNFLMSGIGVGIKAADGMINSTGAGLQSSDLSLYGYGLAAIGLVGALYDVFSGSLTTLKQPRVAVTLKMTPEALAAQEAQQKADTEKLARDMEEQRLAAEEREKAAEAQKKAKAEILEAKQNPKSLNRTEYKKFTVEDFSFDMVAGNLPVGSKVTFRAKFWGKPTGTSYSFRDINGLITLSSDHNFVRDIPELCFTSVWIGSYLAEQTTVDVFITVTKAGQTGTCSVDIVEW
jgi:hypothetical protein